MRAWVLPDGRVERLPDHESHGVAIARMQSDPDFRPLAAGWLRISGPIIQTGSLDNPRLADAFAAFAAESSGPAMVAYSRGAIEVPLDLAERFLADALAGRYGA